MIRKSVVVTSFALSFGIAGAAHAVSFTDIDANADGVLSQDEFFSTFTGAGTSDFTDIDGNGDGIISFDEASATGETSDDGTLTFDEADLNDDGVLTGDEIDHFSPQAQVALMKFDRDGDGIVTLNEVRFSDDPVGSRGNGNLRRMADEDGERGNGRGNGRNRDRERGNNGKGNGNGNGRNN